MILDSLVTGRRKFAVGRVFYAGDVVLDRPVRALEARRRPGDKFGAYTNIDRASRLLGWGRGTTSSTGSVTPCSGPRCAMTFRQSVAMDVRNSGPGQLTNWMSETRDQPDKVPK